MVYLTSASDFQAMNRRIAPSGPAIRRPARPSSPSWSSPTPRIEISMVAVPRGAERVIVLPQGWTALGQSLQLCDSEWQHAVSLRTRVASRCRQHLRPGRRARSDAHDHGQRQPAPRGGGPHVPRRGQRPHLSHECIRLHGDERGLPGILPDAPPARATVQSGLAGPEAVVEMTFVAASAPRQAIGAPPPGIPISPAIRSGRHLYVSGMLGNIAGDGGGRGGANARDAGEDWPHPRRSGRVSGRRRRRARLSDRSPRRSAP